VENQAAPVLAGGVTVQMCIENCGRPSRPRNVIHKPSGVLPKRCHECEDKKYREKLARQQKRYRDKKAAEKQA
jgi:hypothetical protein